MEIDASVLRLLLFFYEDFGDETMMILRLMRMKDFLTRYFENDGSQ